jgi:putative RNA 2'-phosphotransferase
LGKRRQQIKVENLSRFLIYVLGLRPDEFGLVPDVDGFVRYRELLQAIHEEDGWRYVRQSHINEVLMGKDRLLFQTEGKRIRVLKRKWDLDLHTPAPSPPRILYIAVRKRAHPVLMENGLISKAGLHLVLSPDRNMAERIGKRRDQHPVVLEIMSGIAEEQGIRFYSFGNLFICHHIPAKFIAGPPVPKDVLEKRHEDRVAKSKAAPAHDDPTPGTFSLDSARDPDLRRRAKGKKRKGWKEEARKLRKRKRR